MPWRRPIAGRGSLFTCYGYKVKCIYPLVNLEPFSKLYLPLTSFFYRLAFKYQKPEIPTSQYLSILVRSQWFLDDIFAFMIINKYINIKLIEILAFLFLVDITSPPVPVFK